MASIIPSKRSRPPPRGELVQVDSRNGVLIERPFVLRPDSFLMIGRAVNSDIRIELAYASDAHCTIKVGADLEVTLRNVATAGTYVNGELCYGKERRLVFGDKISFVEPRHARALGHVLFRPCARGPLFALSDDDVRAILARLDDDDLVNARLACRAFRDLSEPPAVKRRDAYLRTPALAAYAREALPGYVRAVAHVLWAHLRRELDAASTTTSLNLGSTACELFPEEPFALGMAVAQTLPRLPRLRALHLSYNNLGDEGVKALARALPSVPQLLHLDLSGDNQLGATGVTALAQALRHVPRLQTLNLSSFLTGCTSNKLGATGGMALAEALRHVPQLFALSLGHNQLGDAAEAQLRVAKGPKLEWLSF